MLPSQGVLQPHGATASKIATFKLEHPYESITKVTLVIGVVIEALVIHTSGPDGQPMRRSPVMGHPFSGDTHRIDLAAHRPTDMVVGFVGRCNRHRLTGLGLIVRHTVERNVFSCAWTPDPEVASAALAEHFAVRDAAKTAKMRLGLTDGSGGGSGVGASAAGGRRSSKRGPVLTSEEREAYQEAIEEAKVSAKKAEKGEWEVPRTEEEEEAHISEFMSILRMRQIDVGSAVDRAEKLARRLWTSRVLSMDATLTPLRKLNVIIGVCRWYFNALAYSLAPEPVDRSEPDRLTHKGQKRKAEARRLKER